MKNVCVQCGREFEISPAEANFYQTKGLDLPKRCKFCRDKNSGRNVIVYKEKKKANSIFGFVFLFVSLAVIAAGCFFNKNALFALPFTLITCFVLFVTSSKKVKADFSYSNYKYHFYDAKNFVNHYLKHGKQMGYDNIEDYLCGANNVLLNKKSLQKSTFNGDVAYYNAKNGDFVVLSRAGYIRTYYRTTYKHFLKQ